jgi:hypothetical protein
MSLASLDRLTACHEALIRALDGNDLGALDEASRSLAGAVAAARAEGDWPTGPDLKERLLNLAALAHVAQIRVNFLTDKIRRRIDAVAALRGEPAMTYQPVHR